MEKDRTVSGPPDDIYSKYGTSLTNRDDPIHGAVVQGTELLVVLLAIYIQVLPWPDIW